ncbi:hypothetical protein [Streptomyces sp. CBMA156]|uniref:hypothetical protein n=1 Tax=Streptomyces sp. CBMA156 TaxID=1930280 RepID=UPI0016618CC5|nr:hypothetical protein [Streptomyces sp. CBMA156]MBD0669998.1 hypothetical protein [Streptomyces sp. CBMA156]MBD0674526.1 hypothetical protein [Streptomyces sp. CBMA156]
MALELPAFVHIPPGWNLVWDVNRKRSGTAVRVRRWQPFSERVLGGEQITVVTEEESGRILSVRQFVTALIRDPLPDTGAEQSALDEFATVDPRYAQDLTPLRVDAQVRTWRDTDGKPVVVPVRWAKHAHRTGTYNWITTDPSGGVIEYEIESHWDYRLSRRATEQWDEDAWIAAREGTGPQLEAPAARA